MAKRGPKPKPTKVLKLRGSWRAKLRKDYDIADKDKSEKPQMPSWLSKPAKNEWRKLLPKLYDLGILLKVDVVILSLLCNDIAEYKQNCQTIDGLKSPFIYQPSGRICKHPAFQLRDAAAERIRKLSSELGLSPTARASLTILPKEDKDPIAAKFFKEF